ncbi:LysR family transcriptional regulator [Oerskovia enterophila]|uniref:Hydrogen peroxide-inducible genes activator n=1 Tax=Oerskovia enterophila TaxID=43678 RepID=A0A163T094_9CELL|nr:MULTISPECIES: LysR family transcriptional regulator [Oerskovia]KRC39980.1 LysR family transcriptional regulator [Oerskovia sp. Root22]KRD40706.1 LysR family transcriptional regulator [Oerskovia sp. Root918]KZM36943.1 hydrogen peroxide-inducible genes activator [Oerskovia enterophila]OCI30247.1 hydrogen peroxide-inducible protein activator [Oerskovia enterophila]
MATDPRRLGFLLAVHRAGGVLAAADLLHVTPSAVSQQIARLEAEEGIQVLDRGPRGVTLTPAGRILADAAERIEAEMVEARKAIVAMSEEMTGTVTVGSFQTAIRAVVGPTFASLESRYPGVELDVQEVEPADALRLLRTGDLDVVLLERDEDADSPAPRGMREVPLLDEPWRVVVPATFPTPARLDDVRDAVWLGPEPTTAAARALRRLSRTLGTTLRTRHSYYDFDVALALVAAGQGVAMLPALAVQGEMPDGVTVVPLPGLGSRRLVARHRATRHEPRPVVNAVIDEMVACASAIELG